MGVLPETGWLQWQLEGGSMIPHGATHIENDGTFWNCTNGVWTYWSEVFGWCGYIGAVNQMFLNNKNELGTMYA